MRYIVPDLMIIAEAIRLKLIQAGDANGYIGFDGKSFSKIFHCAELNRNLMCMVQTAKGKILMEVECHLIRLVRNDSTLYIHN